MKQIILIILLFNVILTNKIIAQGCSDAGFCSVGNGFKGHEANLKNTSNNFQESKTVNSYILFFYGI